MKAKFTSYDRTMLIGLLTVARDQLARLEQTQCAIAAFIEETDERQGYASDAVFGRNESPMQSADWLIQCCADDARRNPR